MNMAQQPVQSMSLKIFYKEKLKMNGYRKCNICGKENTTDQWICDCGNIITSLPIMYKDNITEKNDGICKFCGEYFDENEKECPFCFKKRSSFSKAESFYFVSSNGEKQKIPNGISELGRGGFMGKMLNDANAFAVSEKHLLVYNEDGKLSIIDTSRNGTFVNGQKLLSGEKFALEVGDEICLGGIPSHGDKLAFSIILTKE